MSGTVYKTAPHVVAFIDILGATNAILRQADESLAVIHTIYKNAVTAFSECEFPDCDRPKVKIFSDNIVVALPYDASHRNADALFAVAVMSAALQAEFLVRGWLTRGGIGAGDFFMDDLMVWGSALVRAYELESHVAYFPRVVIEPDLAKECGLELILRHTRNTNSLGYAFGKDADGMFRVEPLLDVGGFGVTANLIFNLFEERLLEKQLAEHRGDTKVCQKWIWMAHHVEERRKLFKTARR